MYLYQYTPSGGGIVIFLLNNKICGSEKEIHVLIKQFIILPQSVKKCMKGKSSTKK
jgi:hypothetical protein